MRKGRICFTGSLFLFHQIKLAVYWLEIASLFLLNLRFISNKLMVFFKGV